MIKLRDISKIYGEGKNQCKALDGVSLSIEKGEFIAIMGPSGSGKSTLMNILGALDTPTEGNYYINDEAVDEMSDGELASFRNRNVGFVFQRFNLLNQSSVYENVALPGEYSGLKNLDSRVKERLEEVGLSDKASNKGNELSGGQMQRVAIARALINNPEILMADEPTGNVDSKTGREIMKLIKEIHEKGNTVIVITHDEYVAKYADRVIRIKDGKVESDEKLE